MIAGPPDAAFLEKAWHIRFFVVSPIDGKTRAAQAPADSDRLQAPGCLARQLDQRLAQEDPVFVDELRLGSVQRIHGGQVAFNHGARMRMR